MCRQPHQKSGCKQPGSSSSRTSPFTESRRGRGRAAACSSPSSALEGTVGEKETRKTLTTSLSRNPSTTSRVVWVSNAFRKLRVRRLFSLPTPPTLPLPHAFWKSVSLSWRQGKYSIPLKNSIPLRSVHLPKCTAVPSQLLTWLYSPAQQMRFHSFTMFSPYAASTENRNLTFCPFKLRKAVWRLVFFRVFGVCFFSVKGFVAPVFTRLFAEGRSLWALKGCVIVRYYQNRKKTKTKTKIIIIIIPLQNRFKKEEMDFKLRIWHLKKGDQGIHQWELSNWNVGSVTTRNASIGLSVAC